MDILIRLLMVFEAIICFLLIGVVLLQRTKGQGAGLSFGGGAEAVFGAQMGNILTRATVVLAILFLANTTLLTALPHRSRATSLAERIARDATPAAELPVPTGADDAAALDTAALLESMEIPAAETNVFPAPEAPMPGDTPPAAPAAPDAATPAPEPDAAAPPP